jgi:hypothetical protein
MMKTLTREQYEAFWRDGYLMVEDAVTPAQLAALQAEIAAWLEESRAHKKLFGMPTIDGRPRFDIGAEHSAEKPALRRINNPSHISNAYREVNARRAHDRHGGRPGRAGRQVPSLNEGRIVRDTEARFARLSEGLVELLRQPKSASFFTVIGQESKQAAE